MVGLFFVCILLGLIFAVLACWRFSRLYVNHSLLMDRLQPKKATRQRHRTFVIPQWAWRLADQLSDTGQRFGGGDPNYMRTVLQEAGHPLGLTVERFYGTRALLGLSGIVVAMLVIPLGFGSIWMAILPTVGYFAPGWWLKGQARERQLAIARSLPDFLDTVSISLEAGMALDSAFAAVARRIGGPLGQEIERYAREVELGVPREDALLHVLTRNSCKELNMLLQALVQSYRLGVPVAGVMAQQAQHIRRLRAEKAKETAAKASPKITLATTFLMMPAVLFFIIGMLVLNLIYNGDHMGVSGLF